MILIVTEYYIFSHHNGTISSLIYLTGVTIQKAPIIPGAFLYNKLI